MTGYGRQSRAAGRWLALDIGRHGRLVFLSLVALLIAGSATYLAFDYRAYWRESEQRLTTTAGVVTEFVQQVIAKIGRAHV